LVGLGVEGEGGLEGGRWDNFDAAVLRSIFILDQMFDVGYWALKLSLRWPKCLHLLDLL